MTFWDMSLIHTVKCYYNAVFWTPFLQKVLHYNENLSYRVVSFLFEKFDLFVWVSLVKWIISIQNYTQLVKFHAAKSHHYQRFPKPPLHYEKIRILSHHKCSNPFHYFYQFVFWVLRKWNSAALSMLRSNTQMRQYGSWV